MDEKENQSLELENILKEFGNIPEEPERTQEHPEAQEELKLPDWLDIAAPEEVPEAEPVDLQATRRMEPVQITDSEGGVSGDTIRLDGLRESIAELTGKQKTDAVWIEEETDRNMEDTIRAEPFSERWEPEYDQPMGEYTPPQPIQFHPRSRLQELKRKLVAGPEKRFYDLSEKGVGKLQAAIFLSMLVVLIAAASTAMYAFGMVQENRLRLMVFSQFLAFLVSSLLGCFQIMEGFADLGKKRFTLNTLLGVTFVVCCVDGVLCLQQLRVSCCAAFSLAVTMSLWGAYHRRSTEMAQMDTLRKAIRLNGVAECPEYLDGKKGLLRMEGQVEDFMDHYAAPGKSEKLLDLFGMIGMILALGIGLAAGVLKSSTGDMITSVSTGVQVAAVCLLAAAPASIFVTLTRPMAVLEKKLHNVGAVICGWQGVEGLCGKALFPIGYKDLLPVGCAKMNGVKFFGSRPTDEVVAYCTALVVANDSGLAPVFTQVLESRNGRHYDVQDFHSYDNGGIGGQVNGESVLVGPMSFMKEMGVDVPEGMKVNQAICVSVDGELCGLFALNYESARASAVGVTALCGNRGLNPVVLEDDFLLTEKFICSRFGVKPRKVVFPAYEERIQLREKTADEEVPALALSTRDGLSSFACSVSGARALRTASRLGVIIHMVGGILGLAIMATMTVLGALELLTPANLFAYQLVWMIPGLLITEWTRTA